MAEKRDETHVPMAGNVRLILLFRQLKIDSFPQKFEVLGIVFRFYGHMANNSPYHPPFNTLKNQKSAPLWGPILSIKYRKYLGLAVSLNG